MNGRIRAIRPLIAGLLGFFFAASAATQVRETREDSVEVESDRPFVYDQKSGAFVRVRRPRPSQHPLGKIEINVGYDEQIDRAKDMWPMNVNRFLWKRPLDQ